jgi:hypothetical protein
MSEPTIDELIAQTEDYYRDPEQYMSREYLEAIRAILEEYRDMRFKQVDRDTYTVDESGEVWVKEQKEIQRKKGKTT